MRVLAFCFDLKRLNQKEDIKISMESLILAQDERWRYA